MSDPRAENKTQHVHILMSPSEVEAIDNWGFENRIRTKGEAVRRLCYIGMAFSSRAEKVQKLAVAELLKLNEFRDAMTPLFREEGTEPNVIVDEFARQFPTLLDASRDLSAEISQLMLNALPFQHSGSIEQAEALRKQLVETDPLALRDQDEGNGQHPKSDGNRTDRSRGE